MNYFDHIKTRMPHFFDGVSVLEYTSHDRSKSIRNLFTNSRYVVVDPNSSDLDSIGDRSFTVTISVNNFQHTPDYIRQLERMHRVSSKFVMFSCAAAGHIPKGKGYYKNLTEADFYFGTDIESMFETHRFYADYNESMLYFWGVRYN